MPHLSSGNQTGLGYFAQCYVRVTGTLEGGFVQFEFSIGDPELSVDLVMTYCQFEHFVRRHNAQYLTAEQAAQLDFDRLKWRYGEPGITQ